MSTPKPPGNAPPSWSTVQHSRDLTCQGGCHLEDGYRIAASAYGSVAVDAQESQHLEPFNNPAISISEASQLTTYPTVSNPQVLAGSANLVGHLNRESDSAQVASSLGPVVAKNRASSIQVHASDHVTNHNTTLPPSHSSPLPPHAKEQSSGYPQVIGDVPTSGDPDNNFTAPTMSLFPVLSSHDRGAGRVTGPNAPWPWPPNSAAPAPPELRPSDDFAIGNVPLPPNQNPSTDKLHALVNAPGHQSLARIPSQSTSRAYSTSHGYNWPRPSFPMTNRNSLSSSIQPHYASPVDLPGFRGGVGGLGGRYEGGSHRELSHHGATQYSPQTDRHYSRLQQATSSYAFSKVHGDHPPHALSDQKTRSFYNHAAYSPGDHTTGGAVDDYGNFNASKVNLGQMVDLPPQLPPPPNQLPISPCQLHSPHRVSSIRARSPSRTPRRTRRSATAPSPLSTRPPKACYHNDFTSCGWRDDTGRDCGADVNCGNLNSHLADAHGIKNMSGHKKTPCHWCPSESKTITRKNMSRHVKEVHLGCARH